MLIAPIQRKRCEVVGEALHQRRIPRSTAAGDDALRPLRMLANCARCGCRGQFEQRRLYVAWMQARVQMALKPPQTE